MDTNFSSLSFLSLHDVVGDYCRLHAAAKAPDWTALDPQLESLTSVVPGTSQRLDRTTVLTWMYLNGGRLLHSDLVSKVEGGRIDTKRQSVRKAVNALLKFDAVRLVLVDIPGVTDGSDAGPYSDLERDTAVWIRKCNSIEITFAGMTWLRRAWRARQVAIGRRPNTLQRVHNALLAEEQESKGMEPHWLERSNFVGATDGATRSGQVSGWIGPNVTSVFSLGSIQK